MAALLFRQLSARGCGPRLCTTTAGAQARHLLCSTPTRRQLSTVVSTAGASATTATAVASRSAAASTETGILAYMRSNPYKANVIIATFKTALCDVLVQRYIEGKEQIDWKRNAVFWCFGLGYLGMFQWYIYVTCFKRWFPGMALFASQSLGDKLRNASGMRELLKQVAFDNFVHYPFIYFPFFYVFKETIQGTGYESPLAIPAYGLAKYQTNCVEDNLKMWALWIPGDLIVYAVPLWMRLPLNHGLSFIWTCYLSFLRGSKIGDDEEEAGPTAKNRGAGKLPWTETGVPQQLAGVVRAERAEK
jgi:hypothetical protein